MSQQHRQIMKPRYSQSYRHWTFIENLFHTRHQARPRKHKMTKTQSLPSKNPKRGRSVSRYNTLLEFGNPGRAYTTSLG